MFSYAPLLVSAYDNRIHIIPQPKYLFIFFTLKSLSS